MMGPQPGEKLPILERRLDLVDLVIYGGATWDWYRWHYDAAAAAAAKLPAPLVDGQMLGALLARQALTWAGPRARIQRMQFRFKSMVFAGDTIRCESEVTSVARAADGFVVSLAQRVLVGERVAIESATLDLLTPL
jgi:acyl dehydratase